MEQPFIRNHQYNMVKKQLNFLQHTCQTVSDPRVVNSVRQSVATVMLELFADEEADGKPLWEKVSSLQSAADFKQYLLSLEPYLIPFPQVSNKQLSKLYPKNKKMVVPDLTESNWKMTYLGWDDIASNKRFIVYPMDGELAGIEGKMTPVNKKGVCFLCHRHEETALFTAKSKVKPAGTPEDYYKAVGNYLCVNAQECNQHITDVTALEQFIHSILG